MSHVVFLPRCSHPKGELIGAAMESKDHAFDLNPIEDEFELFAEELPESAQQTPQYPPCNCISTLGCECGLSTFYCFGCVP